MRIVLVFHGLPKANFVSPLAEISANPTLTFEGMSKVHSLVPELRALGSFDALFSSRMARATDTASILSVVFDLENHTLKGLSLYANKEGDEVVYYPGHEGENFGTWRKAGLAALETIFEACRPGETALAVSHRPVIAAIVCAAKGITDHKKIKALADDPGFVAKGFVILDVREEGRLGELKLSVVEQTF